ncbi:glycoside hydrolase family 32 protein [Fibrella sp. HMF5335]|uniref:Glycoside hydrolase family 32 protein n=1 Tax=Fibrella rubiginis TaxID=2817060 RepID=A0A939K8Q9_9BACT|nr:glycoside hydrolase family 32 protein [Fibrella rubiginis]MBO0940000.1 glycoside hydrolase family 32 protein [Fibrella rubiginis]
MKILTLKIALLLTTAHFSLAQPALKAEEYRPRYHFTPPKNWINDPNGTIYANGEYHLFYQHNPFGNEWGHMSWGHATSKDLIRWQHLPLAIPEFTSADGKSQTAIFSGSTVVDKNNQSGLCPVGTKDCMVAIYTGNVSAGGKQTAQYQNLAYSADKGRTWTEYAHNPVLDLHTKEFRDPNVFWYAPGRKWLMAVIKPTDHQAAFYESVNLKDWKLLSLFGPMGDTTRVWECPALFEVPVEGSSAKKWVLTVSSGHRQKNYLAMQYFVGDFDGKTFTPQRQNEILYVDEGKDFYAGIPFNDRPTNRRKPIMIGWLNDWEYANKIPTTPFKGAMSVPRELSLQNTPQGYRLVQTPISLAAFRKKVTTITNMTVDKPTPLGYAGESYELEATITVGSAKKVGIRLLKSGAEESVLTYDTATQTLSFDRTHSGNVTFSDRFPSIESVRVAPQNGRLKLHLLVDKSIIEIFANDGQRVMTDLVFPTKHEGNIELFSDGGAAVFDALTVWEVK